MTSPEKTFKRTHLGVATMSNPRVTKIDFFTAKTLPEPMRKAASEKGAKLGTGVIAVKTIIASPPTYEFVSIGNNPNDVQSFMERLAKEDGAELGITVQRAFQEE